MLKPSSIKQGLYAKQYTDSDFPVWEDGVPQWEHIRENPPV